VKDDERRERGGVAGFGEGGSVEEEERTLGLERRGRGCG